MSPPPLALPLKVVPGSAPFTGHYIVQSGDPDLQVNEVAVLYGRNSAQQAEEIVRWCNEYDELFTAAQRLAFERAEFRIERDALAAALRAAEGFIVGFEDDSTQEGIAELLAQIRAALAKVGG